MGNAICNGNGNGNGNGNENGKGGMMENAPSAHSTENGQWEFDASCRLPLLMAGNVVDIICAVVARSAPAMQIR